MLDPSWVGAKWHELGASYAQVGPSSLAFCQLKAKDRQVWPLSALVGPSRSLFFTPHPQLPNSSTSKSHPWPAQFQNNRGAGGIRREATWIRPPKQIRSLLLYHLFYIKITTNISHSSPFVPMSPLCPAAGGWESAGRRNHSWGLACQVLGRIYNFTNHLQILASKIMI